ncbi:unnamed protein product [Owenia fusiformis]|uniref:Phosphatidylinositol-specific phospholipase C X domain-containing protein n=1 Tax=Owenia fusiformis TaxID=6347 RepID=A0A8S4NRA8_OWEFU|nr:unnamed protein product [Owenia fusiformis]
MRLATLCFGSHLMCIYRSSFDLSHHTTRNHWISISSQDIIPAVRDIDAIENTEQVKDVKDADTPVQSPRDAEPIKAEKENTDADDTVKVEEVKTEAPEEKTEEPEVDEATKYPKANWMGDLPEGLHEVPLTLLSLPGSHDSLAIKSDMSTHMPFSPYNPDIAKCIDQLPSFPLFDNFRTKLKEMNRDWSATQESTILEQLQLGIRYFDLRVAKHHGLIFGEHGLFTGEIWKYLGIIKKFLEDHPKEVVLLYFQNLNNLDEKDTQDFIVRLRQTFGQKIIPRTQIEMTTLNTLWQYNQQVMILFKDENLKLLNRTAARQIWPADKLLYNPWPNMQEGHHLIRFIDKHYECSGTDPGMKFHITQAILSPTIEMAFAGKLEYGSLEEMALQGAQPRVIDWMKTKTSMYVVISDFVNQEIVDAVLSFNKA